MADFEIRAMNASGEIGISALTERSQKARGLAAGITVVFKSRSEAVPYVEAAEAEGFTFSGKEILIR
jgi:hypothetical protein